MKFVFLACSLQVPTVNHSDQTAWSLSVHWVCSAKLSLSLCRDPGTQSILMKLGKTEKSAFLPAILVIVLFILLTLIICLSLNQLLQPGAYDIFSLATLTKKYTHSQSWQLTRLHRKPTT